MTDIPHPPEEKSKTCWDFFDKIYCISLTSRPDRLEMAKNQFSLHGLIDRVEFILVEKHPTNQERGIFESHMQCLKKGVAENAQTILVFEDDIFFSRFNPAKLKRATDFLKSCNEWQGFSLGCISDGSYATHENSIKKIKYRCLAHAYGLHLPFAREMSLHPWSGIPFDELLRLEAEHFYALSPMCAFQGLAGTDNQRLTIHRLRNFFGGLPFIQRANELYQNHKLALTMVPLGILLGGIILFSRLW